MRSAEWSPREVEVIRSMWIGSAGNLPRDPSNRFADDSAASEFGKALFFDRRLSTVGISCGDCHEPGRVFQDGTPLGHGAGTTARRTMPIASTAYSSWFFWDGRADSQWSQALGPLANIGPPFTRFGQWAGLYWVVALVVAGLLIAVHDRRAVRSSNGQTEQRVVVLVDLGLVGRTVQVELTLSRRDEMGFRMLVGREALRQGFLVDSGRSYLGGRPALAVRRRNRGR